VTSAVFSISSFVFQENHIGLKRLESEYGNQRFLSVGCPEESAINF